MCERHLSSFRTGPAAVRRALGMFNPFYGSSLMFRRAAYQMAGGYLLADGWAHDLAFLIRMAAVVS